MHAMVALLQRVRSAAVDIAGERVAEIGSGPPQRMAARKVVEFNLARLVLEIKDQHPALVADFSSA